MRRVFMGITMMAAAMGFAADDDTSPGSKASVDQTREKLLQRFVEEFVEIVPGGSSRDGTLKFPATFRMGSERAAIEKPVHEVMLQRSFAIAKYEVPQNLYANVMGGNPSKWKGPRNSVEMFSWKDAREFCSQITLLLRERKLIADDEVIRLPTEAEWEYCCRAGTNTAYSFGDEPTKPGDADKKASRLNEYAWHTGNAAGNDPPVGALKPNPWGLYDMHGYLWEFVEDSWHEDYGNAPNDGRAWSESDAAAIVLRGGSWKDHFTKLTSSSRRKFGVADVDDAVGLRCVRSKR